MMDIAFLTVAGVAAIAFLFAAAAITQGVL